VIGAGPVGLAAAAHLTSYGPPVVVFEAGTSAGAAMSRWAHVRTFTPCRYIIDPAAEKLLAPTGWTVPALWGRFPASSFGGGHGSWGSWCGAV